MNDDGVPPPEFLRRRLSFLLLGCLVGLVIKQLRHQPLPFDNVETNNAMHGNQERGEEATQQFLRSRFTEAGVMSQLQQAYQPVKDIVQPPLGEGTSRDDPTIQPYEKDYLGVKMALPQNNQLRSNRILYLITPTYVRSTQMVDLTRLTQTIRLAHEAGYHSRIYWIIIEDALHPTHRVRQFLLESGIPFAHKAVKTADSIKQNPKAHRGIEQRNAGLDVVEELGAEGVVYFMDDDNAYSIQLFHELVYTTHVSVFGVGFSGGSAYERCRVDPKTGKVDKLLCTWGTGRPFAVDMAAFAFATQHLARATATGDKMRFTQQSKPGYLESDLISFAANTVAELEPLAANCTRILAWHVKTVGTDKNRNPEGSKKKYKLMKSLA